MGDAESVARDAFEEVALDGLDNILKVGEMDKQAAGPGAVNQYALFVEEAGGMVTIHNLQQHDNIEIYRKAYNIMDKYFPDDEEVDAGISAPNVDASGAFAVCFICFTSRVSTTESLFTQFNQDVSNAPAGGFNFGGQ